MDVQQGTHGDLARDPGQEDIEVSGDSAPTRRRFLRDVGSTGAAVAAGAVLLPALAPSARAASAPLAPPGGNGPGAEWRRRLESFRVRVRAAQDNLSAPFVPHPTNQDEQLYPNRIGSYSKGLPHNAFGEVDGAAYDSLLDAVRRGRPQDFEQVILASSDPAIQRKLVNPQSGLAFDLEGADSHQLSQRAAPAFASAEQAGEIAENYWMALLRDVSFTAYASDPLAQAAASDLSAMSDFRGPKAGGQVTAQTLFRDGAPGTTVGPWVSQFFYRSMPFGAQLVDRKVRCRKAGIDYATSAADWLAMQNGRKPTSDAGHEAVRRYIVNGRDLSEWVHIDVLFQAYFQAALHLLTPPDPSDPDTGGGMGCPPNAGNPYRLSATQDAFGTFGGPYFMTILCEVATRALKSVWWQKWFVHRRLRPEAFAGRIHHKLASGRPYPIHADILSSAVLGRIHTRHGTYFLPQAFPEGSPLHPSYGAGHATVAGACVTMLKALFDESHPVDNPVVPSANGSALVPYVGPGAGQLTVGGELNKLASNVAFGRNIAGVHWRTDGTESMRLGEAVAIGLLRDQRRTYNEDFGGFTFTKFDGTAVTV